MSENAAESGTAGTAGTAAHTTADTCSTHTQETLHAAPAPAPAPPAVHKRTHADSPEDDSVPRRRPRFAAEDRERGKRMLGMLNSTLMRASGPRQPQRQKSAPTPPTPAALAPHGAGSTYDAERRAHDEERAAVRRDLAIVRELAERLVELELAHKAARSQARRLSSFLVTRGGGTAMPPRTDPATYAAISAAYTAGVPLVRPRWCRGTHEVYYLPRTLLPEQEDVLDQQEERTDDALDAADDDWERERSAMQAKLAGAKHRLQQLGVSWK